jgi:PAS domain S-box-containing protein
MNSTAALDNTPPVEADAASAPDAEAEHLRDLIEKQPCCLLRVGLDGLLLAANDAAQQQLGGREPTQVLDHLFTEWIIPEHHAQWHEFAARIREAGSGSMECDLVGLEGVHYAALLQGVLLADHPDGIVSVLLVARDISTTRRLEEALQEHASGRQALAEEYQLALMRKDREGRQQLNALQSKLDWSESEHLRLQKLLEEQEGCGQALVARLNAERAEVEQGVAAARTEREQALKALADQRVELQSLEENAQGLEALVVRLNAERAEVEQGVAAARAERDQALKALADQRVELQSLEENAKSLEPLASAGRLALEVGRELQRRLAAVNAGARALLLGCEETSADRRQIEALLADTTGAASLARQFVQGSTAPDTDPAPRDATSDDVNRPCDSGRTS